MLRELVDTITTSYYFDDLQITREVAERRDI